MLPHMAINGTTICLVVCMHIATLHMSQLERNHLIFCLDWIAKHQQKPHSSTSHQQISNVTDYQEELMLALSSARHTAVASIQQAQQCYKKHYDWSAKSLQACVGDWVLVRRRIWEIS